MTTIKDPERRTKGHYCDHQQWEKLFEQANFRVVMAKHDKLLSSLYLLEKKEIPIVEKQTVVNIDSLGWEWVEEVKAKFAEVKNKPKGENLWLVSEKEKMSGIQGFVRCLKREPGGDKVRYV